MEAREIINLKKDIKVLVNNSDPWYLIEEGAPDDEYNAYIDRIVSYVVNKKPDKVHLEKELYSIFKTNEFDLGKNRIQELTEKILNLISK